jgi:hypothetical protein
MTGKTTLSEKQANKTREKINAVIDAFNWAEAALNRPSPLNPVRIIYREPDPDPEIQQLRQQVIILQKQVNDRQQKEVRPVQTTQDFTLLFTMLLAMATTPQRVEQLLYMMYQHKNNPRLSWDELVDKSYANSTHTDTRPQPGRP